MIYLVMPLGNNFGWGVCGKYITKEMSFLTDVKLITTSDVKNLGEVLDIRFISEKLISKPELDDLMSGTRLYPVIKAINNSNFLPVNPQVNGSKNIGYTFFEDNIIDPKLIENARNNYDVVVTGSSWNEEVLRAYGLENVKTIIQGVDPTVFNPYLNEKEYFKDKFVIFSGGKFELRKGQDIVIKAYKALQDKYDDVMLVNSWYNQWGFSLETMKNSSLIKFEIQSNSYHQIITKALLDNGIDISRVITLPAMMNALLPKIYRNTDIGLFPNRCEGGTNLVLMEYMAMGKPVIASYNTGHKDILNTENSLMIKDMKEIVLSKEGKEFAKWDEPDLEETINHLEWAYHNRDKLQDIGKKAGDDFSNITWKKTAKEFYELTL